MLLITKRITKTFSGTPCNYQIIDISEIYVLQSPTKSNLKCRYVFSYPIAPVKEEQIHEEPNIWIYYDVISKRRAQQVIQLATPKVCEPTEFQINQNQKFVFNLFLKNQKSRRSELVTDVPDVSEVSNHIVSKK